ncbi:MAG: CusA/CzcA family heavy metal efflux RND transporter [Acetobacteraceae bacterium]|nr:CusA/CzcA family heavy metal efflux RND transporter [Acetobacteraceae bacterium]
MFARLVDAALGNRVVVLILIVIMVAAGAASLQSLPIDAQPDISPRQVLVITQAPGLGPLDVERLITAPLELALQGLPRSDNMRSVSRYGLSVIYVRFTDDVDIYAARNLVSSRLPQVQLPPTASAPQLGPISTGLGEIYQFQVRGAGRSLMDLRTILDWQIAPRLRQVPGVIDVNANGGELKTYEIQVSADALVRYGLSVGDVFDAVQRNDGARGGATLEHNGEQAVIRGEGMIQNPTDVGNIVLRTSEGGVPLYVHDVAKVVPAARPRLGAVTRDGKGEAVVGVALMLVGENTRTVAQSVAAAVDAIRPSLPPGVEIDPYYNRADLIGLTIHTVAHNLAEGAILVMLVLFALLGNARAGLIVAAAIPLSMLAAATAMYFAGLSGNLMSLGAIDFGLIVDGAVVMIENVVRRRAESPDLPVDEVIQKAAREVARPIVFAVTIIGVVYLPILSLQGIEGKLFRPMALTVIFALLASLVLTLTLMPVLASFLLRRRMSEHESRIIRWVRSAYAPMLKRTSRYPGWTVSLALVLLLGAAGIATQLGAEFIPRLDEGALTVTTTKLPSIGLSSAVKTQTMIEQTLLKFPEVTTAVTLGGSSEIPTDPMGVEQSDTFIMLRPHAEWRTAHDREGLIAAYSAALNRDVPGLSLSWAQPIEMRMDDMLQGVRSDVAAVIYGSDADVLKKAADGVAQALSHVPGAADVAAEQTSGEPYLRIIVNRQAVARYGMNASQVLDVVEALGGRTVGTMMEGEDRFDIRVRLSPQDRSDFAHIANLRIADGAGRSVPLSQVADIKMEQGPAEIDREHGSRRITVQANVRGRDVASFVADAQKAIAAQVKLPPGYSIEWGGQFKNLQDAMSRLSVVVPTALALIFAILFVMFRNLNLAAMIFFNVPFAAIGGVFALWARGLPFSISAAVGFIALFGIAVLNGVVLVSYMEEKREEGLDLVSAAREAAMARLRPVLMTATVASLGFLPMAISTSAGAEVQRPLATVVIGGLVTATLLTLLVLPAVYPWFRGARRAAQPAGYSPALTQAAE